MRRLFVCLIVLAVSFSSVSLAGHPLRRPTVYVLDYATDHPTDEGFVARATEHPPHVLHIPHDTVIGNTWGTAYAGKRPWVPEATEANKGTLTVEELREVERQLRKMTADLHAGGIDVVAPYICNQTLAGNPDRRRGIWACYDRWEDYRVLGFGPRPKADPIHWFAREPDGKLHFNYEMRHKYFAKFDERRYAPCVNNPHYNTYLETVVKWIARVGMNGVFVDNCILNCYCEHCTAAFRKYLGGRFSPDEIKRRFGVDRADEIRLAERGNKVRFVLRDPGFRGFLQHHATPEQRKELYGTDDLSKAILSEGGNGFLWTRAGEYRRFREQNPQLKAGGSAWYTARPANDWGIETPAQRALWAETQRFWAESMRRSLAAIKKWGSNDGKPFFVYPNWGAMQTITGHEFREEIGHDVAIWAPAVDLIFFEEDTNPGRIADGLYLDFVYQHKYSQAAGTPAIVMNYGRGEEPFVELAMAEGLAHGGGHVKITWNHAPLHRTYRELGDAFFETYRGATTYARVGLALCYREVRMRNRAHLEELYEWVRYLGTQHVLYDILLQGHLNEKHLAGYDVVILPQAAYLSDAELSALRAFCDRGGVLVCTGDFGRFDEAAVPRRHFPYARFLTDQPREIRAGLRISANGKFVHAATMGRLAPQEQVRRDVVWSSGRSKKAMTEMNWTSNAGRYKLMAFGDRLSRVHRYHDAGWLGRHLKATTPAWRPLADARAAAGLRFAAYLLDKPDDRRLALFAINYNLPLTKETTEKKTEENAPKFQPVENVRVSLRLPDGWKVRSVTSCQPSHDPKPLPFKQPADRVEVTLPKVEVLNYLDIRCQ